MYKRQGIVVRNLWLADACCALLGTSLRGVQRLLDFGGGTGLLVVSYTHLDVYKRQAVAQAAMDSGIADRPIADLTAYREKLAQFVYRTSLMMKPVYDRARSDKKRVVYAEGEEYVVLQAVQTVIDEGLALSLIHI